MGIENLQYYAQEDDYDCAAGVTGIVLRTFNITDFTHEQLIKELGVSEEFGADPINIVRCLRKRGLNAVIRTNVTLDQIQRSVSAGQVCIADYQNSRNLSSAFVDLVSGHYGAIDVVNGIVRICDPDSTVGQNNMKSADFMDRFRDFDIHGKVFEGCVIFVSNGKKETI